MTTILVNEYQGFIPLSRYSSLSVTFSVEWSETNLDYFYTVTSYILNLQYPILVPRIVIKVLKSVHT